MPTRNPKTEVQLQKCLEGWACLDVENFKKLLRNELTTEGYIEQLERLLNELAEPVQSK